MHGCTDWVPLLCPACVWLQQPALFVHIRAAGTWWYNTVLQQTPQLGAAYWATGWLLGQAIINRSLVGVQLAPLLFHMLLQPDNGFKV